MSAPRETSALHASIPSLLPEAKCSGVRRPFPCHAICERVYKKRMRRESSALIVSQLAQPTVVVALGSAPRETSALMQAVFPKKAALCSGVRLSCRAMCKHVYKNRISQSSALTVAFSSTYLAFGIGISLEGDQCLNALNAFKISHIMQYDGPHRCMQWGKS